ncbi:MULTISPECIES: hypothetical protein [unclassified Ruegeria]|uniref:hypothetical protein n=1 Tax=unclassified Ruegeria TaxID=2625375 RepID=UPI001ADC04F0|nr:MULTISPECIES: hypothetical protein [unclassified Ruegeria]MBO9410966.1 hypothetical protein [Ruegeria sp. R8_1]MBO9415167.1 hypothetical protein [Ruegeria sp. R8_2]
MLNQTVSLWGPDGLLGTLQGCLIRFSSLILFVVGAFLVTISHPRPAHACPVCVTLPDASLADHLIGAEIIVLAAPSANNPFSFAPIKLIKGSEQELERAPEIPFLIDSTTRAAFRTDPQMSILFTYGAVDKDAAGRSYSRSWKRIFTLTPEREQFLKSLEAASKIWRTSDPNSPERVAFFVNHITANDPVLRDTALIEMDRAPYSVVQSLRPKVPKDQLLNEFRNVYRISFVPVSIRLLGLQTGDAEAVSVVRSRYPRALRSSGGYVYEWALAGIEVDRSHAVKAIDDALRMRNRNLENNRNLVRALVDGGTALPSLRDQIVEVFSRELNSGSDLALDIAIAARNWNVSELDEQLLAVLENDDTDPVTRFVIETKIASNE